MLGYFKHWTFAAIFCVLIVCAQPALAQGTADLVGRVTDTSGAVLPGAMVTAENVATNNMRTTITSETGDYAFNVLPIGAHVVKVELPGFRTYTTRITLATGDRARVEVGADEIETAHVRRIEIERALSAAGFSEFDLAVYRTAAERARGL